MNKGSGIKNHDYPNHYEMIRKSLFNHAFPCMEVLNGEK